MKDEFSWDLCEKPPETIFYISRYLDFWMVQRFRYLVGMMSTNQAGFPLRMVFEADLGCFLVGCLDSKEKVFVKEPVSRNP